MSLELVTEDAIAAVVAEVPIAEIAGAAEDTRKITAMIERSLRAAAPLIVAAELEQIAETLNTSCRMDDLIATVAAGARNSVRNELLARAAELRGGVSGTGDQQ